MSPTERHQKRVVKILYNKVQIVKDYSSTIKGVKKTVFSDTLNLYYTQMPKRITIYAKFSTNDQHPENQVRDLKRFAKDRDLNIVNTYEEKISATKAERPQLQKLLDDVRKLQTNAVLIWKLDRLDRSTQEPLNRFEEFRTLSVELQSYPENIDTTTPADKALFSMVAVFAEFENDIRSERIRAGMANARQKGKHLGRTLTPEATVKQIKQIAKVGLPDAHIMRETGVSRNTVKNIFLGKKSPPTILQRTNSTES